MLSPAQAVQAVQGRKRGLHFDRLLSVECWSSLVSNWNQRLASRNYFPFSFLLFLGLLDKD